MSGVSRGANLAIAAKFPWAQHWTVAGAGPAQGDLPVQVLLKNRHLMGIGFDLAEVGPIFEEYVAATYALVDTPQWIVFDLCCM